MDSKDNTFRLRRSQAAEAEDIDSSVTSATSVSDPPPRILLGLPASPSHIPSQETSPPPQSAGTEGSSWSVRSPFSEHGQGSNNDSAEVVIHQPVRHQGTHVRGIELQAGEVVRTTTEAKESVSSETSATQYSDSIREESSASPPATSYGPPLTASPSQSPSPDGSPRWSFDSSFSFYRGGIGDHLQRVMDLPGVIVPDQNGDDIVLGGDIRLEARMIFAENVVDRVERLFPAADAETMEHVREVSHSVAPFVALIIFMAAPLLLITAGNFVVWHLGFYYPDLLAHSLILWLATVIVILLSHIYTTHLASKRRNDS